MRSGASERPVPNMRPLWKARHLRHLAAAALRPLRGGRMTALRNPDESPREQRPGRWERATDAGYEPHHDDAAPLAAHLKLDPSDPWMKALEESRARVIAMGNLDRCSSCKTTVDLDWSADVCEHDRPFCEDCTFIDGCAECADLEGGA